VTTSDDLRRPLGPDTSAVREPARSHADISPDVLDALTEEHDRIAHDLNNTLMHQMFAVSLDLHAALTRIDHDIDDQHAAEKIRHAISGLDQAIKDLRNAIVGLGTAHNTTAAPRTTGRS
jgi:signal transduction histidine kinase